MPSSLFGMKALFFCFKVLTKHNGGFTTHYVVLSKIMMVLTKNKDMVY